MSGRIQRHGGSVVALELAPTATGLAYLSFLPSFLSNRIEKTILARLKEVDPAHLYYAGDRLHTTVKNVRYARNPRTFTETDAQALVNAGDRVERIWMGLEVALCRLLVLPSSLVLVGLTDERHARFLSEMDNFLLSMGLPDDKSYVRSDVFFVSVTLCRFTAPPSVAWCELVQRMQDHFVGDWALRTLELCTCDVLCSAPGTTSLARHVAG